MISVIIPIFNAADYLPRTIQCLQKQSFSDFEVLLINDGSKDDSARICEDIAKVDGRFKHIYQENQGVSAARNYGLRLSRGEYITFIDADDNFPDNYLERLLEALVSHDCQMSVCDVVVFFNGSEKQRFTCAKAILTQNEALNFLLSRRVINSGPYAKLFTRDLLGELEFPKLKAYEDIVFVLNAIGKCDYIAITSETEYRYIQNESSAMGSFSKMPSTDIIVATEKIMTFLGERKHLEPLCTYITLSHLMQYVLPLVELNNEIAQDFVREAQGVFRKYWKNIVSCRAFPWKEKMTYSLFIGGWVYQNREIRRLKYR